MKKILSLILLTCFCSMSLAKASDAIIIGSNGQARYENENKNEIITKQIEKQENDKNVLQVSDILNTNPEIQNYDSIFKKYYKKIKIMNPNRKFNDGSLFDKKSTYYLKNIDDYDYENDKSLTKIDLLNGDYVRFIKDRKYNANVYYATEYHKDKSLMGFLKITTPLCNEQKQIMQICEYRINGEQYKLTHVMYLYKDSSNFVQYIYKYDKNYKLQCCSINNQVYVAEGAKNMIIPSNESIKHVETCLGPEAKQEQFKYNAETIVGLTALSPIFVAGAGVGLAAGAATAPIWLPLVIWWIIEETH